MRSSSRVLTLFGLLCALCVTGCKSQAPAEQAATRTPAVVGTFDYVSVSTAIEVKLTQGSDHRIAVSGDARALEHLQIIHDDNRLRVELDGELRRAGRIFVELTVPTLRGLEVEGASEVELVGFSELQELDLRVAGASSVSGALSVGTLRMDVTGASELALRGSAAACGLRMTGASDAKLGELECADWSVEATGASSARIHATRSLGPVRLTGASDLSYSGAPALHGVELGGVSDLTQR